MSALAAHIVVSAPRPMARPWATALTTYAELVGPEWEGPVKRWLNGVTFIPFGCEKVVGSTFDPCVLRESEPLDGIGGEAVTFDPFIIEMSVKCSVLSITDADLTEYVLAHTEVARSSVCGAETMQGGLTGNPTLESEAQVITGGDGSPAAALAMIEDALADLLDGGVGMIHATPGVFARLQVQGGLQFINGDWYTATGHSVVADAGYLGPSPTAHEVVADESWMYGSGPVFYKLDDFVNIIGAPWENFDYTRDEVIIHAEQYALTMFEPCSVVATAVTSDAPAGS